MNFDLLHELKDSTNAIVAIEMASGTIVAGNKLARQFFCQEDGSFQMEKLMGDAESKAAFIGMIQEELKRKEDAKLEDAVVYGPSGEKISCDLTFGYLTRDQNHLYMRVRPTVDNRGIILENFIKTRKHPTFTLNLYDNLRVNLANEAFYKCFACTKESFLEKYDNQFLDLLSDAGRSEYEVLIFKSLIEEPTAILNVPVQTAMSRTLYLYYDMNRLSLVESDWNSNLFCMLVRKGETLDELGAAVGT